MYRHSSRFKSINAFLCLAALLLVAKPFLGFSIFSRLHPPSEESIFVKAFTKRKQEYVKGSNYNIATIQKKLAEPVSKFFLRFFTLLSVLFPFVYEKGIAVTNAFLKQLNLSLFRSDTYFKRTGILII